MAIKDRSNGKEKENITIHTKVSETLHKKLVDYSNEFNQGNMSASIKDFLRSGLGQGVKPTVTPENSASTGIPNNVDGIPLGDRIKDMEIMLSDIQNSVDNTLARRASIQTLYVRLCNKLKLKESPEDSKAIEDAAELMVNKGGE